MALWQKFRNVFRSEALNRELDEEFEAHIARIFGGCDMVGWMRDRAEVLEVSSSYPT